MDVKTPSQSKVLKEAITLLGAGTGAALSDGVVGVLPDSKLTRVATVIASGLGAVSVKGSGNGVSAIKAALGGMAVWQFTKLLKGILSQATDGFVNSGEPSKLKQFIADSTGLGAGFPTFIEPGYYQSAAPQEQLGSPYEYKNLMPWGS